MVRTPARALRAGSSRLGHMAAAIIRGDVIAIHDARVLARRSRELLPLCTGCEPDGDTVDRRLRDVLDTLGPLRDLDVELALLDKLAERVPRAARVLAARRSTATSERAQLLAALAPRIDSLFGKRQKRGREGPVAGVETHAGWRGRLRSRLSKRQSRAIDAIERATQLRFAKRLHRARIAIKKLRYVAETAESFGLLADPSVLRRLRRAQRQLGEIHDRQILAGRLRQAARGEQGKGLEALLTEIEKQIQRRYRRYVAKRAALVEACRSISLTSDPRGLESPS